MKYYSIPNFGKAPVFQEMRRTGLGEKEINIFTVLGFSLWAVILGLFSWRQQNIENSDFPNETIKILNEIIISLHVITLLPFTLLESYYLNENIWISWLTIALAVTATFFNTLVTASVIINEPFEDDSPTLSIITLGLQCFANSLMLSYIFRLIRSKKKMMY